MTKSNKKLTSLVVAVMYALCILVASPVQAYAATTGTHVTVSHYSKSQKAAQTKKALAALAKLPSSTTTARYYDSAAEYTSLVSRYNTANNEVYRAKNMGLKYKSFKNYGRLGIAKTRVNYLVAVLKTIRPVVELIDALPTTVTLANEAAVTAANKAYNALSAAQKKMVPNKATLTEAVAAIASLKNPSNIAAAKLVTDAIAALPLPAVMVVADEAKVIAARTAYTALNAEAKILVTNLTVLTVAEAKIAGFKIVVSVSTIADITTQLGTAAVMPTTATITLGSGTTDLANVTWATTPDVSVLGTTAIAGTLSVPAGKTWTLTTAQKAVTVNVIVIPVLTAQLAKVTNALVSTVPFATANTQAGVEAAMLAQANAAVDTGFTVTMVAGSTYNTVAKIWTGKFTVTNNATTAALTDSSYRVLTIVHAASAAGATAELAKITDPKVTTVPYGTANTQVGVEAAMLTLAQAEVAAGYTVTLATGSTYSTVSKIWTGKFKVTNNTTPANTATDAAYRTITIVTAADAIAAATQLAKVTNAVVGTVPFGTANTQVAVEAAMVTLGNAAVSTGFTVSVVAGSTYSTVTKLWTGKFMVTETATTATATDAAYRNFTVTTSVDATGAATELAKVTNAVVLTVPAGTANTQAGVEAAMIASANATISTSYTTTIAAGSTYSTVTKAWTGKFIVTNISTTSNTATDAAYRAFTVIFVDATGASAELAKVTNAVVGTVPFGTLNTQAAVEAAMLTLANAEVNAAYTVTLAAGSTYSTVTKLWTGKFIVTNNVTPTNTATDAAYRNITIVSAADVSGATTELAKIVDADVKVIPAGTPNTQAAVEAAMLVIAQSKVAAGYTVTMAAGSTYSTVSKAWSGKFTVTNDVTPTNTKTDASFRTFIVSTL